MKRSDALWLENLARHACGLTPRDMTGQHEVMAAQALFLEELCSLMMEYANHFNELVRARKPDLSFRVFRLGNPRPGLMLLRGRDKLVVAGEAGRVRARVVQVHAYSERSLDVLEFGMQVDERGDLCWVAIADGQRVTPELVARYYLCPFLAAGSAAFPAVAGGVSRGENRSDSH